MDAGWCRSRDRRAPARATAVAPARIRLPLPALLLALAALLAACSPLPPLEARAPSTPPPDLAATSLGRHIGRAAAGHPGRSGVLPLARGHDAFAARIQLAQAAERTLDVQYYIWQDDLSGTLMMDALRQAADRGVQVRLLLDDNNTAGLDPVLAALAAHPRIAVRLFNPFAWRDWRWLGYVVDFPRLNRRMHNKSFTADRHATVVGGRNMGDAYFDAPVGELLFVDLDVMAVGPVAGEVASDFDRYWDSASAYPVESLLPRPRPGELAALAARAAAVRRDPRGRAYMEAVAGSHFMQDLAAGKLALQWVPVRMLSDDPAKALGRGSHDDLLWPQLAPALEQARAQVDLVSPYFVPAERGTAFLAGLAGRGVRVRVLTNGLASTDVAIAHSGYARRRPALLAGGVRLFELKRSDSLPPTHDQRSPSGSSDASLHAKTFSVDGQRIFVGSFNFDPRSASLNTELGFLIDSPALAQTMAQSLQAELAQRVYEVRRAPDGSLRWVERSGSGERVHDEEPGTGPALRGVVRLLSWLPIEWLL